jgi:hypothetical protein
MVLLKTSAKISALCVVAAVFFLSANAARAESYGSDAPNAGVAAAKAKEKPVKFVHKHYVVHPQVSTKRRGK